MPTLRGALFTPSDHLSTFRHARGVVFSCIYSRFRVTDLDGIISRSYRGYANLAQEFQHFLGEFPTEGRSEPSARRRPTNLIQLANTGLTKIRWTRVRGAARFHAVVHGLNCMGLIKGIMTSQTRVYNSKHHAPPQFCDHHPSLGFRRARTYP